MPRRATRLTVADRVSLAGDLRQLRIGRQILFRPLQNEKRGQALPLFPKPVHLWNSFLARPPAMFQPPVKPTGARDQSHQRDGRRNRIGSRESGSHYNGAGLRHLIRYRFQFRCYLRGGLRPIGWIFRQKPRYQGIECGRQTLTLLRSRWYFGLRSAREQASQRGVGKWQASCRHLIQDQSQRKQVSRGHGLPAFYLFGRHISRRAHHQIHFGETRVVSDRARPKSSTFTPCRVIMTLPGLRSRCTMACACASASAPAICAP